jgi:prepilin peptidase CpaA
MNNTNEYLTVALIMLLSCCAACDVKSSRVPNCLTLPFLFFAICFQWADKGTGGLILSISGMFAGLGILVVPYMLHGMGAGDVKLMGAVGSVLGARATLGAFCCIAIVGGIYSLATILVRRDLYRGFSAENFSILKSMVLLRQHAPLPTANSQQQPRLKYGVAIAVGTFIYLVAQSRGITL